MTIKFRPVALVFLCVAGFTALLKAEQAGGEGMRPALWGLILPVLVVAVALTVLIWSGAYQSAAVPKRLRQWLLGERDQ